MVLRNPFRTLSETCCTRYSLAMGRMLYTFRPSGAYHLGMPAFLYTFRPAGAYIQKPLTRATVQRSMCLAF